jgi:hypothetical protein
VKAPAVTPPPPAAAAETIQTAPVPQVSTPEKKTKKKEDKKASFAPVYAPLQGPAPPVSADKEQRLHALLLQYQADQLTPQQYHEQRAKILAEP